jgi:rare lipoprotein A
MKSSRGYRERGIASWYGTKFHGRKTANGERYDMYAMTAAHKELPIPTYVRVTNLRNGRSAVVRVNDRGPFHNNRIIDLSYAAATKLGIIGKGTGLVEVVALQPGGPAPAPARTFASRPDGNPNMFVQVGAFANKDNADRLRWRLQKSLGRSVRIQRAGSYGSAMFRVQVGPVAGVEQADSLVYRLADLGIHKVQMVIE